MDTLGSVETERDAATLPGGSSRVSNARRKPETLIAPTLAGIKPGPLRTLFFWPAAGKQPIDSFMNYEIEKIAFEGPKEPDRGYTVRASYLKAPNDGDALIEVMLEGIPVRTFLFPAYKIWNIAAHFKDIVDGEIKNSPRGYNMAAWNGISGATIILGEDL